MTHAMKVAGFVIAAAMVTPAAAQHTIGQVELIVPTTAKHMNVLAKVVAKKMSMTRTNKVVVKTMTPAVFGNSIKDHFRKTDGSQLAFISTNTILLTPLLISKLEPVAMLGRTNLSLLVPDSTKIRNIADFKTVKSMPLKIAVHSAGARLAALTVLGPLGVSVHPTFSPQFSKSLRQLRQGTIDALVSPTAFVPHNLGVKALRLPVLASINYGIVGPSNLSQDKARQTSKQFEELLKDKEFRKMLREFGVQPHYQNSDEYRKYQQQVQNDYCTYCNCKTDDRCKRICDKCN